MLIALHLFALQGLLGATDTLFYHEWTSRLAWKTQAIPELRFHCVRSFAYCLLFGGLAWYQPQGAFAVVTLVLLGVEVVLTLGDFVVEDRVRVLAPGERILHTLMGILWGAFLANIVPVLLVDAGQPAAMAYRDAGWLSWVLSVWAAGVLAWSLREGVAAFRLSRRAAAM